MGIFDLKNWVRFQAKRHIMDMQRSGNANWRQIPDGCFAESNLYDTEGMWRGVVMGE